MIVNGAMEVEQGITSIASAVDGDRMCDVWTYNKIGSFVHSFSKGDGLKAGIVTVASIAATDECVIVHKIEGWRWKRYFGKAFNLPFSVKAPAGTYCVSLRNDVPDISCVLEYTVNQSGIWEDKVLAVPPAPSGTWNFDSNCGMRLGFVIALGTNYRTPNTGWQFGYFHGTPNQINCMGDFSIKNIGSPQDYPEELAKCQRYRYRLGNCAAGAKLLNGVVSSPTTAEFFVPCAMRATPSVSFSGFTAWDASVFPAVTAMAVSAWTPSGVQVSVTAAGGGLTAGRACMLRSGGTSDFLELDARL